MKTQEELNALKEEVETVAKKLNQLTPEELEAISGGFKVAPNGDMSVWEQFMNWLFKIPN